VTVLFTGRGTSGSFAIRGEQLGRAVGGVVQPNALDVAGYRLAVVVKRPGEVLARLHAADVPVVFDIVDSWPQPAGNGWTDRECMAWLSQQVKAIRPVGIVAATQRMAQDCAAFGVPVLALPHHARPGLKANPIREKVQKVGYEGGEQYITRWRKFIEAECAKRGWRFVVNPASLSDVDIVLGLRDQSGYAPKNWKSNVKLANAQGSGTPVILSPEAGYQETACGAELWVETQSDLRLAFDEMESRSDRLLRSEQLKKAAISLDSVASTYRAWLKTLSS
jgi:hypothetical protein